MIDWGLPVKMMPLSANQPKRQLTEKSSNYTPLRVGLVMYLIFPVPCTRQSPGFVIFDSFATGYGQTSRSEAGHDQGAHFTLNYSEGLNLSPCLSSDYIALKLESKGCLCFFSKLAVDLTGADLSITRHSTSSFPDSVSLHGSLTSGKIIMNSETQFLAVKTKRDH